MPHDAEYLNNQYKQRHALELKQEKEKTDEQFAAINAVLSARIKSNCRSLTCVRCGNSECFDAAKEYFKLWPDGKKTILNQNKELVSLALIRQESTQKQGLSSNANSQNSQERQKSEHHGQSANGLNLFNLEQQSEK